MFPKTNFQIPSFCFHYINNNEGIFGAYKTFPHFHILYVSCNQLACFIFEGVYTNVG